MVTVVMVLTCMTVGIVFNDLSTVVGITGAIGGSSLMAIIPSLLYIKYTKVSEAKNKCWNYTLAGLYLTMGLILAVVGSIVTLMK